MDAMPRIWCFLMICSACLVHHLQADQRSSLCSRPLNSGDCGDKPSYVYTYSKTTNRCVREVWRGCPSTNKFDTEAICNSVCKNSNKYLELEDKMGLFEVWDIIDYAYDYRLVENNDKNQDTYVKFYAEPLTWRLAWKNCLDDGASLGVPESKKMLHHILYIVHKYAPCGKIHTSCHRTYTNTYDFHCIQGTIMHDRYPFLQWSLFNSENKTNEINVGDVVILKSIGSIAIASKDEKRPYFCTKKKNKKDAKEAPLCNGKGYGFMGGMCYKFHLEKKTWDAASKICNSEDAYLSVAEPLAAPLFEEETTFLTEANYLFSLYLKNTTITRQHVVENNEPTAFIGHINFSKRPRTIQWHSIFGYDFKGGILDFCNTAADHCGTIIGNYKSEDRATVMDYQATTGCQPCDTELPFICEKKSRGFMVELGLA